MPTATTSCSRAGSFTLWAQDETTSSSDGWSVADDWNSLSRENPYNTIPDSNAIFNQDIAQNAARSILADNHGEEIPPLSEEDAWVQEIIEDIVTDPLSSTPLYDTPDRPSSKRHKTPQQQQQEMEQRMEDEIAMLIRCNESPEDMLVRSGKAVADLTVEEKLDVSQLLVWQKRKKGKQGGRWQASPFLKKAVRQIFRTYATHNEKDDLLVMDAKGVAQWMTRSIGDELGTYTERIKKGQQLTSARQKKSFKIAKHDSRVLKMITQYSTYGTGYLTLENLERTYMEALTRIPRATCGSGKAKSEESLEVLQLRNFEHIRQVWRDLRNHGIVGPTEQKWKKERQSLQEEYGTVQQQTQKLLESGAEFVDECEVLEYGAYEPPPTAQQLEKGHDVKNHKYIKESSHEKVQLAADGKTPLYIEEGQFVFIDEESCIGCMQCVNIAPNSFLMLEDGRARTFKQRSGGDVKQGVMSCPVSCMHFVSYDELKELETVRDKGDGRDDHRHMGHKRGHTPLHVSRRTSDNNHRSSWYHYIRYKCCTSGRCPQRGCFDCPSYRQPGGNPFFQKRAKEAQHIRANHFINNGDVDLWRKTADL